MVMANGSVSARKYGVPGNSSLTGLSRVAMQPNCSAAATFFCAVSKRRTRITKGDGRKWWWGNSFWNIRGNSKLWVGIISRLWVVEIISRFWVRRRRSSRSSFVIITERGFPSTDKFFMKFFSNPTYFYFLPTEWVFFFRVFVISKFKIICYIRIEKHYANHVEAF